MRGAAMLALAVLGMAALAPALAIAAPNPYAYGFWRIQSPEERPIEHPEIERRYTRQFNRCLADPELSTMTHNFCLKAEMRAQDQRLNRQWRKTLGRKTLARLKPAAIVQLRAAERAWIVGRDTHCRQASDDYAGGTLAGIEFGDCMVTETILRTIWLENLR